MGHPVYQDATSVLITADAGGSNGARLRLWKWELQQLANRTAAGLNLQNAKLAVGTPSPSMTLAVPAGAAANGVPFNLTLSGLLDDGKRFTGTSIDLGFAAGLPGGAVANGGWAWHNGTGTACK